MTSTSETPLTVERELALRQRIAELEQTVRRLRSNEQRFRQLFARSPDAIFVEDLAGNVLDANPAACRLHDLPRDQLIGKHVMELVPLDKREEVAHVFPKLVAGE
jgi:PAS domain S-box-containing protein